MRISDLWLGRQARPASAEVRTSKPRLPYGQYDGLGDPEYQPGDIPLATFTKMLTRDSTVSFALDFISQGIDRRVAGYQHPQAPVQSFVNEQVMPAMKRSLRDLLTAIHYGVSVAEPIYRVVDGRQGLANMHVVHPERYWDGNGFRRDAWGQVAEIEVFDGDSARVVQFEQAGVPRVVHFPFRGHFDNPWGKPAARTAYPPWYVKTQLLKWEAIALEKHGIPIAIFKAPANLTGAEGTDDPAQQVVDEWTSMGEAAALALDTQADDIRKVFMVVDSQFKSGSPFDQVIRRLDQYIYQSYYQPALLGQEAQFGTYAQANVQLGTYLLAEEQLAKEFASRLLLPQIIDRIVAMNWGPGAAVGGRIKFQDSKPVDDSRFAQNLVFLSNVGLFDPAIEEQARWAGDHMDMPVEEGLAKGLLKRPEQQSGSPPSLSDATEAF